MSLASSVYAIPVDSKPQPAGFTNSAAADVIGVVNAYSDLDGTILETVIELRPGVCELLPGGSAEVTWKKFPDSAGEPD